MRMTSSVSPRNGRRTIGVVGSSLIRAFDGSSPTSYAGPAAVRLILRFASIVHFQSGRGRRAAPGRQLYRWVFVGATKLPGLVRYRAAGRALLKRRLSI